MKRRANQALKDEWRVVISSQLESTKKELSDRIERSADRLIGKKNGRSSSVVTVIGGRPESNRRKF